MLRKIKFVGLQCVRSFKCFTALDIRPPEVSVKFKNASNSYSAGAPPDTHAGELLTLSNRLGLGPRARRGGRTKVSPGRHRPSCRY